ncbi:DNA primase large subunit-like [Cydia amplana]|uniref:DNA primase large subunit-like n=1 Tax=Cydia amplana TaxID=1869771 RepID=UPI002FE6961F
MSFYYLTPVKGDMPAHLLETIVSTRLDFLKAIYKGDTIVYNEYMVEGSIYDNVGHFMLCIVTILTGNTAFSQFFLKAETELFKRRINTLSAYDLRRFAKRLLNSIKRSDDTPSCEALKVLCQHLVLKNLAHHISISHNTNCSIHSIELNFKQCLMFVASRQVEMKQGMAKLPCGKWLQYLLSLFNTNLRYRISQTDVTPLRSDPRITDMLNKIRKDLIPFMSSNTEVLLSRNVDSSTKFFPPCMLNLHRNLRARHRLSHTQRFFYSLFLKDIGMPVEEAIDFWRNEYKLNPNGTHVCCHSWEKDEKKYLYGIRHMYGLEGGRKNYTSVNCQRIQGSDNACSEGGCPFKFDYQQMVKLLPGCPDNVLSQINEFKRKRQYNAACRTYLQSSLNTDCDSISFSFTPVKYYMIASKYEMQSN